MSVPKHYVFDDEGKLTEVRGYKDDVVVERWGIVYDEEDKPVGLKPLPVKEVIPQSMLDKIKFWRKPKPLTQILSVDFIGLIQYIGLINKINRIAKIDLIDEITKIKTVDKINAFETDVILPEITHVTAIDDVGTVNLVNTINLIKTISSITNIANVQSVDLIDNLTNLGTLNLLNTINLIKSISSIDAITNILNIDSIDLIDRITKVDEITKIEEISTIRDLTHAPSEIILNPSFEDDFVGWATDNKPEISQTYAKWLKKSCRFPLGDGIIKQVFPIALKVDSFSKLYLWVLTLGTFGHAITVHYFYTDNSDSSENISTTVADVWQMKTLSPTAGKVIECLDIMGNPDSRDTFIDDIILVLV